jgi:Zn-dependent protease
MDFDFVNIMYSIPPVIVGLTIHEYFHAFTSFQLGDNTAKEQGRLTLNPLKHIDLIGMLFIIIAGFGWAKPVQFNPENLKHPKRDRALIALAGPISNLLLSLSIIFLFKIVLLFCGIFQIPLNEIVSKIFIYFIFINLGLFIFNLIPLPPLDGSHVLFQGLNLKPELENKIYKIGKYVLFGILIIENRSGIDILPIGKVINWIFELFF